MAEALVIRDLTDRERAWANAQYRAIRFAATPPGSVALVAELAGARVGLGRLVAHEPGVIELGGIWTDEPARGHGVARAMVTALLGRLAPHPPGATIGDARSGEGSSPGLGPDATGDRTGSAAAWCIPFGHLAAFYRSFGFVDRQPPWPPPIAAKVAACVAQGLPAVVVLAR
jgi:GNAT superfamily N-acetyltransferase